LFRTSPRKITKNTPKCIHSIGVRGCGTFCKEIIVLDQHNLLHPWTEEKSGFEGISAK
jgi:hypothetical protein